MGMHCVGALHSEMLDWLNVGVLQLYDVDVEATADFGRGWSQWGARPTVVDLETVSRDRDGSDLTKGQTQQWTDLMCV